ncbi:MAG: hypothetical protein GTO08_09655, partial [Deltaproteobacteria bacterium]|nr:hypothetical protein [Deltaproteobacteria bacterium]
AGAIVMLIIGSLEKIRSMKLAPHLFPELSADDFRELKRLLSHFGNRMCVAAIFLVFIPITEDRTIVAMLAAGCCGLLVTAIISQKRANKILKSHRMSYKTMVQRLQKRKR